MTIDEYFAQQEKRNFPLPKHLKPYTHTKIMFGGAIELARKDNGTGRITLLSEEKPKRLYLQGVTWRELESEATKVRDILVKEVQNEQRARRCLGTRNRGRE